MFCTYQRLAVQAAGLERFLLRKLQPLRGQPPGAASTSLALWLLDVLLARRYSPADARHGAGGAAAAEPAHAGEAQQVGATTQAGAGETRCGGQQQVAASENTASRRQERAAAPYLGPRNPLFAQSDDDAAHNATADASNDLARSSSISVERLLEDFKRHLPQAPVERVLREACCWAELAVAARVYGNSQLLFGLLLPRACLSWPHSCPCVTCAHVCRLVDCPRAVAVRVHGNSQLLIGLLLSHACDALVFT